jgi:MFS family permease
MKENNLSVSFALLRSRRFGTFWFASLLSNIGTWVQQVAQPWLLLSLNASSFLIGLDSFALGAPGWLLTLVGGMLADRSDRRRVITQFQSIQMLCPVLLVILLLFGSVRPWMVILLSLVVGITDALSMPSFQSIVPSIVARNQIPAGLALNSTQFNLSRIMGPAIAGVLLVGIGAAGCFAVSALSYIPFIVVALWILPSRPKKSRLGRGDGSKMWTDSKKIFRTPFLQGAFLTVFLSSLLCAQLLTFSPILVKNAFHGDASHFSIAVTAFGIGGLMGAIALLFVDADGGRRRLCASFAGIYGMILILAALCPWFWGLVALLTLAGMSMGISNISANTLLQANIPAHLRGQTVSLYMLAMRGGLSIGSLLTGISASWLGVSWALLLNGVLAVLLQSIVGYRWMRASAPNFGSP